MSQSHSSLQSTVKNYSDLVIKFKGDDSGSNLTIDDHFETTTNQDGDVENHKVESLKFSDGSPNGLIVNLKNELLFVDEDESLTKDINSDNSSYFRFGTLDSFKSTLISSIDFILINEISLSLFLSDIFIVFRKLLIKKESLKSITILFVLDRDTIS